MMVHRIGLALLLVFILAGHAFADDGPRACVAAAERQTVWQTGPSRTDGALCATDTSYPAEAPEQLAACCKICRTGKACGNSCISRSKTCHKGPGCACNAQ